MLPENLTAVLSDISDLDNDSKSYYLIDLSDSFKSKVIDKPYPEEHRVPACESEVYLWVSNENDKYYIDFVVENPQGISAKAMAVILQDSMNGLTKQEINAIPDDIAYLIFGKSLSMGKGLGLVSMVQLIKYFVNLK